MLSDGKWRENEMWTRKVERKTCFYERIGMFLD